MNDEDFEFDDDDTDDDIQFGCEYCNNILMYDDIENMWNCPNCDMWDEWKTTI